MSLKTWLMTGLLALGAKNASAQDASAQQTDKDTPLKEIKVPEIKLNAEGTTEIAPWDIIQTADTVAITKTTQKPRPEIKFVDGIDRTVKVLFRKWMNDKQKSCIVDYYCNAIEQTFGKRPTQLTLDQQDIEALWAMEKMPRDVGMFRDTEYQKYHMTAENFRNIIPDSIANEIAEKAKHSITPANYQEGFCFHGVKKTLSELKLLPEKFFNLGRMPDAIPYFENSPNFVVMHTDCTKARYTPNGSMRGYYGGKKQGKTYLGHGGTSVIIDGEHRDFSDKNRRTQPDNRRNSHSSYENRMETIITAHSTHSLKNCIDIVTWQVYDEEKEQYKNMAPLNPNTEITKEFLTIPQPKDLQLMWADIQQNNTEYESQFDRNANGYVEAGPAINNYPLIAKNCHRIGRSGGRKTTAKNNLQTKRVQNAVGRAIAAKKARTT